MLATSASSSSARLAPLAVVVGGPTGPQSLRPVAQPYHQSAFSPASPHHQAHAQSQPQQTFVPSSNPYYSSTSTSMSGSAACALLLPFLQGPVDLPFPAFAAGAAPQISGPSVGGGMPALAALPLPPQISLVGSWVTGNAPANTSMTGRSLGSSTSSSAPSSPPSCAATGGAAATDSCLTPASLVTSGAPMSHLLWTVVQLLGTKIAGLAEKALSGDLADSDRDLALAHIAELAAYSPYLKLIKDDAMTGNKRKAGAEPEPRPTSSSTTSTASPSSPSPTEQSPLPQRMPTSSLRQVKTERRPRSFSTGETGPRAAAHNSLSAAVDEDEVITDGVVGLNLLRSAGCTTTTSASTSTSSSASSASAHMLSSLCSSTTDTTSSSSSSAASLLSLFTTPWPSAASYGASTHHQLSASLNDRSSTNSSADLMAASASEALTSLAGSAVSTSPARKSSSSSSSSPASSPTVNSPGSASPPQLDLSTKSPTPACRKTSSCDGGGGRKKRCAHCGTGNSSVWRRGYDNVRLCNACGLRWSRNKRKSGIDDERAARRTRGVRVRRKPVQQDNTKEELNGEDGEDEDVAMMSDASEDEENEEEWVKRDRSEGDTPNHEDNREDEPVA